jgi:uridylate kinase
MEPVFKRILLKLSGEALEGTLRAGGIDSAVLGGIANQIKEVCDLGVQVGVVVGGGNFFRGLTHATGEGMERSAADTIGMLATGMNCVALQDALEQRGQDATMLSAIPLGAVAQRFSRRSALAALTARPSQVVLLAGGTGHPYFTTDTAAALRALEIGADVLLKATKVDGIYSADPLLHPGAVRFDTLTYEQVLQQRLAVMDLTAITLCRDNNLPLVVFDLMRPGNIRRVVLGEAVGSRVHG